MFVQEEYVLTTVFFTLTYIHESTSPFTTVQDERVVITQKAIIHLLLNTLLVTLSASNTFNLDEIYTR